MNCGLTKISSQIHFQSENVLSQHNQPSPVGDIWKSLQQSETSFCNGQTNKICINKILQMECAESVSSKHATVEVEQARGSSARHYLVNFYTSHDPHVQAHGTRLQVQLTTFKSSN